jgi:protoporphyrinogen oxidase
VILVVGAGPAGLAAAWTAARAGHDVTVVERADRVGGMAASRTVAGLRVDHGSHRLHPATDPTLLADLRGLLGDDLQTRPRNGRIHLAGRWVGFPLRPADLVRSLPPRFAAGAAIDALTARLRRPRADTFGEVVRAGLGPTVADGFYRPYARKLWDADPEELAGELARRRVSASGPMEVARRLVRGAQPTGRTFLYPRNGFGQIPDAVAEAAVAAGASIRLGTGLAAIDPAHRADGTVSATLDDGSTVDATAVLSTMPVTALATMLDAETVALAHRAMLIVWVVLDQPRWTGFDAHYLPDPSHPVARLSEPRNYRDNPDDPAGTTVLCAEVPCWVDDDLWSATDDDLGAVVAAACDAEGLPPVRPAAVEVARLPRVYPVYRPGFEWELARAETWVAAAGGGRIVTLGRQGLFVPDNTHHALAMGQAAAGCLGQDGTVDAAAWAVARAGFRDNVVED